MKVLIASAEMSPLARTGGLGEAVAGLARALAASGVTVTVVMPRYRHLFDLGTSREIAGVDVWEHAIGDVTVWLIDDPDAFDRDGIYGPQPGTGYDDQWSRFGTFSANLNRLSPGF
ncbi:MAG: glycogen/starch synthase, partial [Acidimicrobiia bacterium]|nr:glycogen/starch synthase [Acidimicrobiia bacterium]